MDVHTNKRVKVEGEEDHVNDTLDAYIWKLCANETIQNRSAIKEHAVQQAIDHLQSLCSILRKHAEDDNSPTGQALCNWITMTEGIMVMHRQFQVLVGVAGKTGAGKTSLLNALLGTFELLPSSQEQAATAVSCKVSYNWSATSDTEARAVVYFQSLDEIKSQLVLTLRAFKEYADIDNNNYTDLDEKDEVKKVAACEKKEGMHKIRAVWQKSETHIENEALECQSDEDFSQAAQKILDSNESALNMLRAETRIFSDEVVEVAKLIRPFLDSTDFKHDGAEKFAVWPLIKNVDIFLRNELLRRGLCFVDLPGVGDNVESRAKIAEEYRSKLNVTIIVAGIDRATDEDSTQSLLSSSEEMKLRMQRGSQNPHIFGVVLSKMEGIDAKSYGVSKPEESEDPLVVKHLEIIDQAQRDIEAFESELDATRESIMSLKKAKKSLEKIPTRTLEEERELRATKDDLTNGRDQAEKLEKRIVSKKKAIEKSQQHHKHWSIITRNDFINKRLQREFRERQAKLAAEEEKDSTDYEGGGFEPHTLDVMACSARSFWDLRQKRVQLDSFPTDEYTGIPAVQQWVHLVTADRREQHLDHILEMASNALHGIERWCKTDKLDLEVKVDLKTLNAELSARYSDFQRDMHSLLMDFHKDVAGINPFEKPLSPKKKFNARAMEVAHRWAMKYPDDETTTDKMAWNSYKNLARLRGGPYTTKGKKIIDAQTLISTITATWTNEINVKLPGLWGHHKAAVDDLLNGLFESIMELAGEFDTSLPTCLVGARQEVLNVRKAVNSEVKELIHSFQKGSNAFAAAKNTIRAYLDPAFRKCEDIKGPGSFLKRREAVETHVKRNSSKIFDVAWTAIKDDLEMAKKNIHTKLKVLALDTREQVRVHFDLAINKALGDEDSPKTLDVHKRVQSILDQWRDDWRFPPSEKTHILQQNLSIPTELHLPDTTKIKKEDDSDSGSDSDNDMAADVGAAKVKGEAEVDSM